MSPFPFGNRATMYPGSAPLEDIFLAEVSGSNIKTPWMLNANNSRRPSEKGEPKAPRADGDIEFNSFSVPTKNNELGPAEGDLETGSFEKHLGTVKVLVTSKPRRPGVYEAKLINIKYPVQGKCGTICASSYGIIFMLEFACLNLNISHSRINMI